MTDDDINLELSRRKILAGAGAIGLAGAGAGLGTSAYFSDTETFTNNSLTAGSLDMKVAATEYYSDWSADEAALAGMADSPGSTDIRLPAPDDNPDAQDIALDLNDVEPDSGPDIFEQFVTAISSNEDEESYNTVNGGISAASSGLCGTDADADGPVIIDISDVKPGDFGGAQFAFELCDNPGYVWLQGALRDASEGEPAYTEPELDDPDEDGPEGDTVELLDEIQIAYGVGDVQDSTAFEDTDAGFQPTNQMSLREFLDAASTGKGVPLEGDIDSVQGGGVGQQPCFSGSPDDDSAVHQVSVVWWLPINHGNQIQTDEATFDLGFYTEQCRHNAAVDTVAVYNDFYQYFNAESSITFVNPDEVASWAYAANQADAFGAIVGFEPNTPRSMQSASFIMSNWNGWDPSGGSGVATASYQKEITLELYEVDRSGSDPAAGAQIDTFTEQHTIEGRQLPDPSSGFRGGGGTFFEIDFDLGGITLPDEVLFMISFDPNPSDDQDPEHSLNIGSTKTGTARDATAGQVVDSNGVYWRSDANTGGNIARFEAGPPFAKFLADD